MGPLSNRYQLEVGGYMGCSVGFYLYGINRGVCRIVGLVWAILLTGAVVIQ